MATLHSKIEIFLKDRDESLGREDASKEERAASSHKIIDMIDAEALSPKEDVTPLAGEAGAVEGDDGDMTLIGRSFMASLDTITAMDGPYKDWTPAEDPAELVLDLYNDLIEARENALSLTPPKAETETGAEMKASTPVQDTWFTDRALPVIAMSGDVESDRVIKLHFRRPVTDADRRALCDAMNLYQRSLAEPAPAETASERERLREDDTLLANAYLAMRDAMGVIDANEGPGLKHSRVLNALAASRVEIERRNAARAALSTEMGR